MSKDKEESLFQKIIKGPSLGYTDNFPKRQIWREIVKELNGEFKIKHNSGNELEIHNIKIPYKQFELFLSVSDTRPLKFQISFRPIIDFNLVISWEDFLERILKKFGKPEIQLGRKEFDNHYLIKSNRSDIVKRVFTNEIQKAMLKHNIYSISYETNMKKHESNLISVIQRQVEDKDEIFELIDLFKLLIDNFETTKVIR
jgi:hypothetical protein